MYMRHYYIRLFLDWNQPIKWPITRLPHKRRDFTIVDQILEWHGGF